MNTAAKSLTLVVWHHRVLGVLWMLCGLAPTVGIIANPSRNGAAILVSVLTSAIYVGTSIGFIFGRTWARRVMGVLMLIAALFFLDMLLMFGFGGNAKGVWMMMAALGITAYTVLFLTISAFNHPPVPPVL